METDSGRQEELLTVTEIGKILSLGKTTIYRLIERGEIEVVDLGPKSKRVTWGALEKFLLGRLSTAPKKS